MRTRSLLFLLSLLLLGAWLGVLTPQAQCAGTVVAWGNPSQAPAPAGLNEVAAIAAGRDHNLALKNDGTVVAWGDNAYGRATVPAAAQSTVVAVAASIYHSVALKNNGRVVAWGYNDYGQTSVPGAALSGATAISAGYGHTVALKSDGSVVAWGLNSVGQTSVPVEAQSGVIAISAGQLQTVALKNDGTVVAWGKIYDGSNYVPTFVPPGLNGVIAIAAGDSHIAALKNDGTVVAWGHNLRGQTNVPAGLSGVTAIAVGFYHTVALKNDGTVVAWGDTQFGQTPVPAGLTGVTAIAAGDFHTFALVGNPSLPRLPLQPQKIFLAFNQPSSFSAGFLFKFNTRFPKTFPLGSNPAAPMANPTILSVTSKIQDIFARSGVYNIEWTTTDSDDAVAVYFCPTLTPDVWYGITLGKPDQFNDNRRGKCIVFVTGMDQVDAASAAHEIGHALGLQHVDPNTGIDPLHEEVMQTVGDFTGPFPKFINAVTVGSDSSLSKKGTTHNPLYHLLQFVDGWSPIELHAAGINPGSWDSGSPTTVRFSFQNASLRLHDIMVFASGGNSESTYMLDQIPSATLYELSQRSFTVPEGMGVVLLASSTTNGEPDVISSSGDPFVSTNQILSADSPTNTFSLFRQDSPTNAVEVSTATAEFDTQTPYCNILASAPRVLRLDFRGTLQTSSNLTDWADAGAVSPEFIVIGSTNKAGFFRSRQ